MRAILVICSFLAVSCSGASAGDPVIATYELKFGGPIEAMMEWTPFFSIDNPDAPSPSGFLSGHTFVGGDFDGTVYPLTGDFSVAIEILTNGIDDLIHFGTTVPGDPSLLYEASVESAFFGGQPGLAGPDLSGYTITEIGVAGLDLFFLGDAYFIVMEFSLYGQPIPAPGVPVALCLTGIWASRRRRAAA